LRGEMSGIAGSYLDTSDAGTPMINGAAADLCAP
jgi:hypothetical protein